jgi:hypothetical protein
MLSKSLNRDKVLAEPSLVSSNTIAGVVLAAGAGYAYMNGIGRK